MSDKAKTIVDEAIAAARRITDGPSVYPRALGMLEGVLRELYGRLAVAENTRKRLAEAQRTIEALHECHGETEDLLRDKGFDAYQELDGTFTVHSPRADVPVFSGTEAEVLAWMTSDEALEVAA